MRHFKTLALTAFIGSASLAVPTMDLQFVKRWNVSGPIKCDFRKAVSRPQGGIVAYGKISTDIGIAVIDEGGNVIATRRWDSVKRLDEGGAHIAVDSAGDVYMMSNGLGQSACSILYLTKYDGTSLSIEWERTISAPSGSFYSYILSPSGTGGSESMMIVGVNNTQGWAFRYSTAGSLLGTTNLPAGITLRTSLSAPATMQNGVILGGYKADKAWIGHINGAGSLLLDQQFNIANSVITALALSPAGRIMAAGGGFSGGLSMFRQESNGTFNTFTNAGMNMADGMDRGSGDIYVISADVSGGSRKILSFNGATGAFGTPLENEGFQGQVVANTQIEYYSVGGGTGYGATNPISKAFSTNNFTLQSSAVDGNDIISVGTAGLLHSIRFGKLAEGITITGYAPREVVAALPDGQGGFVQLIKPTDWGTSYLQRLSPAGTVLWTRAVAVPNQPLQSWAGLTQIPNGDYILGGGSAGGVTLARVTQAGALVMAKRLNTGSQSISGMRIDSQNRVWIFGTTTNGGGYLGQAKRMNLDGSSVQTYTGETGMFRVCPLPNDRVAMLDGSNPVKLKVLDSEGQLVNSYDVSTTVWADLDTDPQGRIASAGAQGSTLEIMVRNPDWSPSLQTQILNAYDPKVRLLAGGEIRVTYHTVGGRRIRAYGATGAMMWDQPIPATVDIVQDVDLDPSNGWTYLVCGEGSGDDENVNVIRYLANGVRSAQRRTAGNSRIGMLIQGSYWCLGQVTTRGRAKEAFAAKWSLP